MVRRGDPHLLARRLALGREQLHMEHHRIGEVESVVDLARDAGDVVTDPLMRGALLEECLALGLERPGPAVPAHRHPDDVAEADAGGEQQQRGESGHGCTETKSPHPHRVAGVPAGKPGPS